MAKSAALKKSVATPSKASKKATSKPQAKAKSTGTKLKMVKPAAKTLKSKTVTKKAPAKPAAKKAEVKKVARPITKKSATPVAAKAKPAAKPAAKKAAPAKVAAKKPAIKTAKTDAQKAGKKMTARPISVPPGFNRAARINSIVKKRAQSKATKNTGFKIGCHVVYPTHGVGKIIAEEVQEIGGTTLKMFVIEFVKDKMTLRVPMHRAQASGLRHVSGNDEIKKMYDTLKSKAKTSRGMWSRRAQEYDAKINSGDVIMIAEVVRDLHQNVDQAERSYSERMIYESAFNRLAGELSASESMAYESAGDKLLKLLRAKRIEAEAA